jgi:hypothetical protein
VEPSVGVPHGAVAGSYWGKGGGVSGETRRVSKNLKGLLAGNDTLAR